MVDGARVDRRDFLRFGGLSLFLLGLERSPLRAHSLAPVAATRDGVLVVFFQRGAADGLHMVAPYRDRHYRSARGALALPEPGRGDDRPLDLGDGFALHPALGALYPSYQRQRLAIVHAVGSPDSTRSHFDAQDYMESGTPGVKSTRDGWLARALGAMAARGETLGPWSAVALTSSLPRSLAGARTAMAMPDFSRLSRGRGDEALAERIERLYGADSDPAFRDASAEAALARRRFAELAPLARLSRPGVQYPRGKLQRPFSDLAKLVKSDLGIRVAFLEGGGWDTHFRQGAVSGPMADQMRELAGCIAAFLLDVGGDRRLTLMTATEFGRTVAMNGAGGTDHGHGSAMMIVGDWVAGGRVVSEFPGLAPSALNEARDLAVTTDFRSLFGEVASRTLALPPGTELFPRFRSRPVGVMS